MHRVPLREHGQHKADLDFGDINRAIRIRPGVVSITPCFDARRARVARFIESTYRDAYGARMRVAYPHLISIRDAGGRLLAAAGFRFAADEPLFVERYMDAPAESVLDTPRERIAECGNLASRGGGASIYLFAALAAWLDDVNIDRVVVTSTASLSRRFERLGLEPHRLCAADPKRIPDAELTWGSYYEARPWVVSGRVEQAVARLRGLFGTHYYRRRPRLFPMFHFDGAPC